MNESNPYHCEHPKTAIRRRTFTNGTEHFVAQCLTCGSHTRSHQKQSLEVHQALAAGPILPFDENLRAAFLDHARGRSKELRQEKGVEWWQWYEGYLVSDEWAEKRRLVLKRDDYTCQGCQAATATEVHHITYRHAGDEFLFELVSLCGACHTKLTEQDRESWANG